MPVDLSTNSGELTKARSDVLSEESTTSWAIFGYEKKSDTLKVSLTSIIKDDDLDDFLEEFEGSKIQYGFAKVKDPNQGITKYILINWFGEGAPELRKGACAQHVRDVERFFHAHVTINARNETDLDKDAILKLVAKSSGAAYSVHKEKLRKEFSADPSGPIGTSYQNEFQSKGIASSNDRSSFWRKQEEEESVRQKELQEKQHADQRALEEEQRRLALEREHSQPDPEPEPEPEPESEPEPEQEIDPVQENFAPTDDSQNVETNDTTNVSSSTGLRAKALYDYQAEEEGEISFDPGDLIEDIEQIDEGWWQGSCHGQFGLFPANYVELL
eukprot:gene895-4158_t